MSSCTIRRSEFLGFRSYAATAVVGLICTYSGLIQPAVASDNIWTFNGNGNWDEGSKWLFGIPAEGAGVTAVIDDGDTAVTVTLDSSHSIGALSLGSDDALLIDSSNTSVTLTSAAGFTNSGTIRLTGSNVNTSSRLTINSGTLTNSATGQIQFQAGQELPRFDGDLVNNGTVTVSKDTTFDKFQGSTTNNNLITIPSGVTLSITGNSTLTNSAGSLNLDGTLAIAGSTYNHTGGTLNFGAGALIDQGTFNYTGGTLSGAIRLRNSTFSIGAGTNAASFNLLDSNTLASNVLSNDIITLDSSNNSVTLSSANGFTNSGTIRFTGSNVNTASRLTVNSGTLTNSATGQIQFQAGSELPRFDGDLVNNGTVTVSKDTTFDKFQGSTTNNNLITIPSGVTLSITGNSTLTNSAGSLNLDGTLAIAGSTYNHTGGTLNFGAGALIDQGTFNYTGGTLSGAIRLRNSTFSIGAGTNAASFNLLDSNTLASNVLSNDIITLDSSNNSVTLSSANGFTNSGTIRFTGSNVNTASRLTVNSGTLTNSATGQIQFQAGQELPRFDGDLVNNGTVTVSKDTTFDKFQGSTTNNNLITIPSGVTLSITGNSTLTNSAGSLNLDGTLAIAGSTYNHTGGTLNFGAGALIDQGTFNYTGGTLSGAIRLRNSTFSIGAGTNAASFNLLDSNTLASNVLSNDIITLDSSNNSVTLSSANGFTNSGTIRFTGSNVNTASRLTVNSGTLTNSATGQIQFQAGSELPRFDGDLVNNGTVTVSKDTTFDKFQGSTTNNNLITIPSGVTLSITGNSTLTNSAGSLNLDGTLAIAGSAYNHTGGTLNFGAGALIDQGTFNYTNGTLSGAIRLRNANLSMGAVVNPASFFALDSNTLISNVAAGVTITSDATNNNVTLNSANAFINNGTILLSGNNVNTSSRLTLNNGSLSNSATGLIHFQGANSALRFDGDLVNNGVVTVDQDTVFDKFQGSYTNNGRINVTAGKSLLITSQGILTNMGSTTLTGGIYDLAGDFRFPSAYVATNEAELILHGGTITNLSGDDALQQLTVNGTAGKLRVLGFDTEAHVFTNDGLIELGGGNFRFGLPFSGVQAAFINSSTGQIIGSGVFESNFTSGTFTNAGIISPGTSPGILQIGNAYTQTATGNLKIGINGNNNSDPQNPQFDVLKVSDVAHLGGALTLALDGSFTPSFSDVYTVFDAISFTGAFANIANGQRLATTGGEGSFVVTYNAGIGNVILSNFAINGDYNANGIVDAGDYVLWRKTPASYGGAGGYATWRANFGRTNLGSGSGTSLVSQTAVPEPATYLLCILGFVSLPAIRRTRLPRGK